ncbi:O-sialoglycoprotein endopeptidase [Paraclostridium ghonii]|uniref:N6-L-threonylcarbamoyladenine synthase n=1 Tax=Paraclostridium ghonii TaxID=29358 RepID=A0ABU0MVW8_9FIRM|nr:O-sialoglycoprotein endopeptidase [Paeniclostridium ghonii]MDQ0555047.1 N6-L-threonylcarbamoyladenine synthase [Paeniclostridium ghonii]
MKSKKSKNIIIGIDTSCYTTSIAAISLEKSIVFNEKIMLKVKKDSKGLRQSEMVFQHVNNLGKISDNLKSVMNEYNVCAICASEKPRPIKDSYMPAFTVGYNFAKLFSDINNIKLYSTTHQENHIHASLYDNKLKKNKFISVHMSGGTTEILLVENIDNNLQVKIIGGSKDISFGQLIDRLGVQLGYEFPCGKYIDKNALECEENIEIGIKTSVKDGYMNLSGIENQINKYTKEFNEKYVSKLLMDSIVRNLYKSLKFLCKDYNIDEIVFAGGVASSKYIKDNLSKKLMKDKIISYFTKPEYSVDNALGCALIGLNKFIGE